ncbi:MAG TPA: Swt1 family HEPN domain-containing protein, partial [bacterium]
HITISKISEMLAIDNLGGTEKAESDFLQKMIKLFQFSSKVLACLLYTRRNEIDRFLETFSESKSVYFQNALPIDLNLVDNVKDFLTLPLALGKDQLFVYLLFNQCGIIQNDFLKVFSAFMDICSPDAKENELRWLEQSIAICLPHNKNPLQNSGWYWPLKLRLNELFINFFLSQNEMDKVFQYAENEAIDFVQINQDYHFIIPPKEFPEPYSFGYDDESWCSIKTPSFGDDDWMHPLKKFYLPCQIYWEIAKKLKSDAIRKVLFQRIAKLAEEINDHFRNSEKLYSTSLEDEIVEVSERTYYAACYPTFVGKVFEELGDFDRAIHFYEHSHMESDEKLRARDRCIFLRDGVRWEPLRKELRALSKSEQRQLLAYIKIFKFENRLRKVVSQLIETHHGNKNWWDSYVQDDVKRKCQQRFEEWRHYPNEVTPEKDINLIEFSTLSELRSIIIESNNWEKVFKAQFRTQKIFSSILILLEPIRNDIAHARLLDDDRFEELSRLITRLTNQIDKIERSIFPA